MSKWKPAHGKSLVCLTWNDAHGSATQVHTEADIEHEPMLMTTYGILLREDAVGVTLANEWCGGKEWRGLTFVPRALVVKLEQLLPAARHKQPLASSAEPVVAPSESQTSDPKH